MCACTECQNNCQIVHVFDLLQLGEESSSFPSRYMVQTSVGCAIDHCIWVMVSKVLCNFQLQVVLAKDHVGKTGLSLARRTPKSTVAVFCCQVRPLSQVSFHMYQYNKSLHYFYVKFANFRISIFI